MFRGIPSLLMSGGFSPYSISNLFAWYQTQTITGKNDGDTVNSWIEFTGNKNLTTNNNLYLPIFKTNIINGYPVLRYDGSQWDGSTGTFLRNTSFSLSQPDTIFIVAKQTDKSGFGGQLIESATVPRQGMAYTNQGRYEILAGGVLEDAIDHSGAFHVLTFIANGASSFGYVDGTQTISGDASDGSEPVLVVGSNGGNKTLIGDIAEIIFYSKLLSSTERQNVENYLKRKYAIA